MASPDQGKSLDDLIQVISDHIGLEWKFLARILGFTETDIDAIEYAHVLNLREQIYQFFYQWKRNSGDDATKALLLTAVECADLSELLKTLKKKGFCDADDPPIEPAGTPLSPAGSNDLPLDTSTPRCPPTLPNCRLDEDVVPDSTSSTEQHESAPTATTPRPQSSPIANNLHTTNASTQGAASAEKDSPNLARSTPQSKQPGQQETETEREFVRRKRLERILSNASNNSTTSDNSGNHDDVQKQTSCSSVPESPNQSTEGRNDLSNASPEQRRPQQAVCPFELGDMVMVERPDAALWYGVVRWIGDLPGKPGKPVIGMEMESEVLGGGDGMIDGQQFFSCVGKHGLFLPVERVKKDNRFDDTDDSIENEAPVNRSNSGAGLGSNVTSNTISNESAPFSGMRSVGDLLHDLNLSSDTPTPSGGASNSETDDGQERVLIFTIPADHAGLVIGREGRNIQEVERLTNTNIQMERDYGGLGGHKKGIIRGSEENQKKALQMILNRLKRRVDRHTAKAETIQIPESKVGLVIGRGGETKNAIKRLSGVLDIKIDEDPVGLQSFSLFSGPQTRSCVITGSEKDIEKAKQLINLAAMGGNIVVGATLAALIADLANLGVNVEEESS